MDRNEKKLLLVAAHTSCSLFLPIANNLAHSALNANDALIHPELGLVAGLGAPRPRPAQGGNRISEEVLSHMSDPQCVYSFR